MSAKKATPKRYIKNHADGTVWARGFKVGEAMTGYWELFRKDGTKMRSGYFDGDEQISTWTTYDKKGRVYKVTEMR